MDLSDAIKEAYECAPSDVTYYDTLEIDHASFTTPIRVVRSYRALSTNQGEYLPVMFDFSLPETEGGVRGEMKITLSGVPKEARVKIREAATSRNPVSVMWRQYIAEDSDPDAELPVALQVSSIKETATGVEASAMFPDLVGAPFPRRMMTVKELPGCAT
jgi:hypothetical protein